MAPSALRKMKARGGTWSNLWQRFGFFTESQKQIITALRERGPVIWMHAVSVGEVGIARKLIAEMLRRQPKLRFVLSTTTPTGFALAKEYAERDPQQLVVIYNPLDGWFSVRRCFDLICPAKLVLVEAELWPNLLSTATRRGIPVELVNARLSPRSERRYTKFNVIVRPIFQMLDRVLVQEPEDVARWGALGVDRARIEHTGSIKFDLHGLREPVEKIARFRKLLESVGWTSAQPVLLAASTHDGEEIEITRVFMQLRTKHPGLFLIIVSRHVERSAKIENDLRSTGLNIARRSVLEKELNTGNLLDILLVDTTGELRAWQYLATMVVIGKSFLATGGQNPAEALMAGKPVVFGPHMENFDALVRMLLQKHGAIEVQDFEQLVPCIHHLLENPDEAAKIANAGREALRAHEGATQRVAERLLAPE